MRRCPKCRSNCVHHRAPTTPIQRLRRRITHKTLYRCATCGWTGWGFEFRPHTPASHDAAPVPASVDSDPDLHKLDEALEDARQRRKSNPASPRS